MPKILISLIFLSLTLILGLFLIWPKYQDFKDLGLQISQKEEELKSREEYINKLKDISQELEKYQEGLSKIDSALPQEPSLPSLFDFLQKTSSQSGLVLKNIGDVATLSPENSEVKELYCNLSLSGSYSALKNFLLTIENSARLIKVENITFSSKEEEPFSFNVKIKVHSY